LHAAFKFNGQIQLLLLTETTRKDIEKEQTKQSSAKSRGDDKLAGLVKYRRLGA
jgi:hypothetical protein